MVTKHVARKFRGQLKNGGQLPAGVCARCAKDVEDHDGGRDDDQDRICADCNDGPAAPDFDGPALGVAEDECPATLRSGDLRSIGVDLRDWG